MRMCRQKLFQRHCGGLLSQFTAVLSDNASRFAYVEFPFGKVEIENNVIAKIRWLNVVYHNATFIGRIRRYEQGTVYERMAVAPEDFLSYESRMPSYEKQVKFAHKIQLIQEKIELETSFLGALQQQRKYLLNAMFI